MRQLFTWIFSAFLAAPLAAQEVVLTFGGDVNFARSGQTPLPDRVRKNGVFALKNITATLAQEWTGDVNFVNVESVVGASDGAIQWGKKFVFRSHPKQFQHLIALGVNAFSLANNHAHDHGRAGLRSTLEFFRAEATSTPMLYAGIGIGEAAFKPRVATIKGIRFAMAAVSFGSGNFAPARDQVGMAYLLKASHYNKVLDGLKAAKADIKILSVHYGTENKTGLNFGQAALYRRAVNEAGVNLVLGHHPHVVRGIEALPQNDAAIFYSLGNLLFIGGAPKDTHRLGVDYGLLGKAYFSIANSRAKLKALEAVPFKGVHLKPRRPKPQRIAATIDHLNKLSARTVGESAARFTLTGPHQMRAIACFGGPYPPRAKTRCCRVERSLNCDLPDLM